MMAVQLDEQTLTAPVAAITQGAILLLVNLVVGGVHASMPLPPGIKVGVAVLYSLSLAFLIVVLEHRSDGGEEATAATRFYSLALVCFWAGYACMELFTCYFQRATSALSARVEQLRTRLRSEMSQVLAMERITGELEEARKRSLMIARDRVKTTRLCPQPVYERDLDSDGATAGSAGDEDAIVRMT